MNWIDAMWLGLPAGELQRKQIYHGDLTGRFAFYRHSFTLTEPARLTVNITANTRYRLWVNGCPVCSGPCKGDRFRWYYETVELTDLLTVGKNVLAVQVLYTDHYASVTQFDERAPILAVYSPGGAHRLAVEGVGKTASGEAVCVTTGTALWKAWLDGSSFLRSQAVTNCMGAVCESWDLSRVPHGWKEPAFDDSAWQAARPLEPVVQEDAPHRLGLLRRFPVCERPIPLLYERETAFEQELLQPSGLLQAGSCLVQAGTSRRFLLDAGTEMSGYPVLRFRGGKGSRVAVTYLEKFTGEAARTKTDAERGTVAGLTDELLLDGPEITFEPFWYRTFRFVCIDVRAAEDTAVFAPTFRKTGYPLKAESYVRSSVPWVCEVWTMCVRTLENCMTETYMDCPYYEQNQFPMDTRLQALFCACLSRDARLTMKALEDFHCSISPDGLVHGRYPSSYQQIISTFSLHYIYMLEEAWRKRGELDPFRRYLPDLDRILGYYDSCIGADGLVGRLGYWEFVDWQAAWERLYGVPEALEHGPSTIINLMYAVALERAAGLWQAAGRPFLAAEYRARKDAILDRVQALCWDAGRSMYREGPSFAQFTQHAQSWAVLSGLAEGQTARQVLRHAIEDPDVLRVSFSTAFEWFRALELAGMYSKTEADMARWAALPGQGNTTCPETPENSRSECHAWSALPIYEFTAVLAGVRAEHGRLTIRPNLSYLPDLEGQVLTPAGTVRFRYRRQAEGVVCELGLEDGMEAELITPDGVKRTLCGQTQYQIRYEEEQQ